MNKHVLTGRPTADPEVSYFGKDGEQKMMAKITLASNHMHDKDADFFRCVGGRVTCAGAKGLPSFCTAVFYFLIE